MQWHQYLLDERTEKIAALLRFLSGDLAISKAGDGERVDATEVAIERLRRNIAEIEQILSAAGIQIDEALITALPSGTRETATIVPVGSPALPIVPDLGPLAR